MTKHQRKLADVSSTRAVALVGHLRDGHTSQRCLLGEWQDPDGRVVIHVNCQDFARRLAHDLWLRYEVYSDVHPEQGVLIWV